MMKQTLLTGWDFMRWLRLGIGVFVGIQAFQMHDALAGFISAFFLFQAITNTGCCGSSSCAVPNQKASIKSIEDAEFQEVLK